MANISFDYVIYHTNCSDGISSAWVTSLVNNNAIRFGCVAGKNPNIEIENLREKTVVFCDISPTPEYVEELQSVSAKIIVIDHHIDAVNKIKKYSSNTVIIYTSVDYEKSGCILTWEYFFPEKRVPWFLKYISDRDTWTWKLPCSKEVNTALFEDECISIKGLNSLYMSYNASNKYCGGCYVSGCNCNGKLDLNDMKSRGETIVEFRNKTVEKYVKSAIACKVKDTNYYVWLYTCLNGYKSDVGNALLNKSITITIDLPEEKHDKMKVNPDFTVCYMYDIKTGDFWLSLRSNDDKVDVCEISKRLDTKGCGGGHRNAAGCTLSNGVSLKDWFIPI